VATSDDPAAAAARVESAIAYILAALQSRVAAGVALPGPVPGSAGGPAAG
jgi:hypothetical protein